MNKTTCEVRDSVTTIQSFSNIKATLVLHKCMSKKIRRMEQATYFLKWNTTIRAEKTWTISSMQVLLPTSTMATARTTTRPLFCGKAIATLTLRSQARSQRNLHGTTRPVRQATPTKKKNRQLEITLNTTRWGSSTVTITTGTTFKTRFDRDYIPRAIRTPWNIQKNTIRRNKVTLR